MDPRHSLLDMLYLRMVDICFTKKNTMNLDMLYRHSITIVLIALILNIIVLELLKYMVFDGIVPWWASNFTYTLFGVWIGMMLMRYIMQKMRKETPPNQQKWRLN
jgi:hypothetical protein